MNKPIIVLGAGGHARVLLDSLKLQGLDVRGVTDVDAGRVDRGKLSASFLGGDDEVLRYKPEQVLLVNGLGSVRVGSKRAELFRRFKEKGYVFLNAIHPSAILAGDIHLGEGVQIMAGVVIQTGSAIGDNTIINTRVIVDHDCLIGANVHLAPGVILSGGVSIGDGTHLGPGSVVVQGRQIGKNCFVKALALVRDNLKDGSVVPAASVSEDV